MNKKAISRKYKIGDKVEIKTLEEMSYIWDSDFIVYLRRSIHLGVGSSIHYE